MNVWKCVRLWCWISQHFCKKVVWYTKQCRKNVNKIMWKCGRWMTAHCQAQTSVLVARFPFWLHCMNFILWKQLICNCYTYFYASLHSKLSEFTSTLDYYYYRWKLVSFSFYSFSIIVFHGITVSSHGMSVANTIRMVAIKEFAIRTVVKAT